ncbi:hypothetical protein SV7mr_24310 [Stieleria bergensis]|uniref:Uncharacterized protein n=1 Tax=Stieleria bergensis TaxID=2528025 RepID=A0A517SUY5_9BACT|nr:hypothetical protein SV7mr_24310 [Planctomycetes bacterium SV_7m_r]
MGRDSANVCIIEHRERGGSETLPAVPQSNRQPMISGDDEVLLMEIFFIQFASWKPQLAHSLGLSLSQRMDLPTSDCTTCDSDSGRISVAARQGDAGGTNSIRAGKR